MVFITGVHMAGGTSHEHIDELRWLDCSNSTSKTFSTSSCVDWLRKGHKAHVADANGAVEVQVVNANPPYVRTVADGRYTDNLLSLPRY